ncbi:fructosamine kinase family protein [Microbacterium sp. NEAU-LLC]|uniref:Fructosamine kinase family protein n=1 Tax=Microbacterium helvum TaxID=2773713 RepID=A0ABR8NSL6_9MICO|nr:fructosamine kinase family protein [Microbacterium helvum]MBD3943600.1 fructosamine kinase family protein [Microbacterium helvum]
MLNDDQWSPSFLPPGRSTRHIRRLAGGFASPVWLCELDGGEEVVIKAPAEDRADLFATEAAGLQTLTSLGGLRTPRVLATGPRSIALEALEPDAPGADAFWQEAGRSVARMHATTPHRRFGWDRDGWLGLLPQRNGWDADGHRFFAENRVLRYLAEPRVEAALDGSDRSGIERLCGRLPTLIPDTGARLTHGDLWRNNVVADRAGRPAVIDPAVSYGWAEVDIAHMLCSGGVPDSFFAAYAEIRPLHADWQEHAHILNLRQLLAMLAAGIPIPTIVGSIRELISAYA